jgi:hypothetical protein
MSKSRCILAAVSIATVASRATPSAQAQVRRQRPGIMSNMIGIGLPVAFWVITGGVLGAVAWPMVSTGQLVAAPIASVGALINSGASVGTVIGGIGNYMTH